MPPPPRDWARRGGGTKSISGGGVKSGWMSAGSVIWFMVGKPWDWQRPLCLGLFVCRLRMAFPSRSVRMGLLGARDGIGRELDVLERNFLPDKLAAYATTYFAGPKRSMSRPGTNRNVGFPRTWPPIHTQKRSHALGRSPSGGDVWVPEHWEVVYNRSEVWGGPRHSLPVRYCTIAGTQ